MMKKVGTLLLTLIFCIGVLPASAFATGELEDGAIVGGEETDDPEIYESESGYTYTVSDGAATIVGYDKATGAVSIPAELDDYPVTAIGDGAFAKKAQLQSVTVPEGVERIGEYAFGSCTALQEVNLPVSLTALGSEAFASCTKLTTVTIPAQTTELGDWLFESCESLTEILVDAENPSYCSVDGVLLDRAQTELICCPGGFSGSYEVPDSVQVIRESAFAGCGKLTAVSLGAGVTTVESSAFYRCESLTTVMLPNSLTELGSRVFQGCTSLTEATLPEGMTSIPRGLFQLCSSLTAVKLPSAVTEIGDYAFDGCSALSAITVPDTVTSIGYSTFAGCAALTEVNLPQSVETVQAMAFERCVDLKKVTVENRDAALGDNLFYGCEGLTIYSYRDSTAEVYATEHGHQFQALDAEPDDDTTEDGSGDVPAEEANEEPDNEAEEYPNGEGGGEVPEPGNDAALVEPPVESENGKSQPGPSVKANEVGLEKTDTTAQKINAVETADESRAALWAAILAVSLVGLCWGLFSGKRSGEKKKG